MLGSRMGSEESLSFLERIRKFMDKIFKIGEKEVVILVDGPNTLRKINGKRVSLKDIIEEVKKIGRIRAAKAVITTDAPASLIKALQTSGFEIILAKEEAIYVTLAIETMKIIHEYSPDVIVIVSRDSRCLPIVHKIKQRGIKVYVAGYEPGFSTALKNAADDIIYLKLQGGE